MAGPKQEGGRRKPPALVTIRAAQPRDRRAVRRLCARIWSDDYVPEMFDEWVRDRRGRLWVAVEERAVVGVAKLTVAPSGEAWLQGLRVDPDHRRRGIATALLEQRLQRAGRLGARVARLDTGEENLAVRRLMRRHGFRRIARLAWYEASAIGAARPRSAGISELDAVWRLMRPRGRLLYEPHFAREILRDDIAAAIDAGRCLVAGPPGRPRSAALVEAVRDRQGSRLMTRVLVGLPAARIELLRALRGEAKARRLSGAATAAPSDLWRSATAAGYRRRWPDLTFIFEKRLGRRRDRAESRAPARVASIGPR